MRLGNKPDIEGADIRLENGAAVTVKTFTLLCYRVQMGRRELKADGAKGYGYITVRNRRMDGSAEK